MAELNFFRGEKTADKPTDEVEIHEHATVSFRLLAFYYTRQLDEIWSDLLKILQAIEYYVISRIISATINGDLGNRKFHSTSGFVRNSVWELSKNKVPNEISLILHLTSRVCTLIESFSSLLIRFEMESFFNFLVTFWQGSRIPFLKNKL